MAIVMMLAGLTAASAGDLLVENLADAGPGSLRQAILDANASAPADTIAFQTGLEGVIVLASPLPPITGETAIVGPGADLLTVSGNELQRVFTIDSGALVEISGLEITGGQDVISGGGISNEGDLMLNDCIVRGNSAPNGGGGGIDNFGGQLVINRCRITGNTADFGGGIANDGGTISIFESTIADNSSSSIGGGIDNVGVLNLLRSLVSGNVSDLGGGVSNGDQMLAINSTVSGNTADTNGGGIENFFGSLELLHVTLAENAAQNGGGLWSNGGLGLKNNVFAGNSIGDDCRFAAGQVDLFGDNLASDDSCSGFTTASIAELALAPLADNGGPTRTHALGSASLAVDAAPDCTAIDGVTPVEADQRGFSRPEGLACDAGAFESLFSSGAPAMQVTPERVDFGDLPLDQESDLRMVLVENIGTADLVIASLQIQGADSGDYSVSGDSCSGQTVPEQGACGFDVVFTPVGNGLSRAELLIFSNVADSPRSLELTGSVDLVFIDGFESP